MIQREASENVVEVTDLSRQFEIGKKALDGIRLRVRPGLVYGLVGANGAGKTTLIKHLLGSLRAKQGSVRVFGLDPVKNPVEVLRRIGYLSEDRDLPEWMRIDELMRLTAAYHPNWDADYGTSAGGRGSRQCVSGVVGLRHFQRCKHLRTIRSSSSRIHFSPRFHEADFDGSARGCADAVQRHRRSGLLSDSRRARFGFDAHDLSHRGSLGVPCLHGDMLYRRRVVDGNRYLAMDCNRVVVARNCADVVDD